MSELFQDLPRFPVALPDDELRLLATLPDYDPITQEVMEIDQDDEAAARRLEKRGLIKVHRWKDDPIAIRLTMYAGRLPSSRLSDALKKEDRP